MRLNIIYCKQALHNYRLELQNYLNQNIHLMLLFISAQNLDTINNIFIIISESLISFIRDHNYSAVGNTYY